MPILDLKHDKKFSEFRRCLEEKKLANIIQIEGKNASC